MSMSDIKKEKQSELDKRLVGKLAWSMGEWEQGTCYGSWLGQVRSGLVRLGNLGVGIRIRGLHSHNVIQVVCPSRKEICRPTFTPDLLGQQPVDNMTT